MTLLLKDKKAKQQQENGGSFLHLEVSLFVDLKNKELTLEKKFSLIVYSSEFLEFLYIDPYLFNNFCLSLCC